MATTAGSTRINIDLALNTRGFRPLGRINGQLGEFEKSLDASNARVLAFGASAGAILAVRKAFTATVKSAIEVEKSLKDINVILQVTSANLQKFGSNLFKIASDTGQSFKVAAEAATELARQGLGVEETLKRTKDALILSRLAGLDAAEAVNALTAALNTFTKVGLDSTAIINKLANVDAAFAVSSEDLAKALGRVGSAAVSAGVDLDQLLAIVTTAQQKTARGGAVIGNSFKTIFTRIQRPRVIKELENLGVQVRGLEGDTLPAIRVLENLAKQFDNLSQSQRAQISELVGGVFQVNVLKAALSDLSREQGIYNRALGISIGSSDQAIRRNEELNQTLAAQFQKTLNTFKEAAAEIGGLTFGPALENIFGSINKTFEAAAGDGALAKAGQGIAKTVFESIGKFIGGPGLVIVGAVLVKTFLTLATFAADAFRSLVGLNQNLQNQLNLQKQIFGVLSENPDLMNRIRNGTLSVEDAHQLVLQRINEETTALDNQLLVSQRIAETLSRGGVAFSSDFGATAGGTREFRAGKRNNRRGGRSGGYVPNFANEEVLGMMMGGYSSSQLANPRVRRDTIHNGRGGAFSAMTNGHESVVDFTNSMGKKATAVIPPKGSAAYEDFVKALSGGFIPNFAKISTLQARKMIKAGENVPGYNNRTDLTAAEKEQARLNTQAKNKKNAASKKAKTPTMPFFNVGGHYGVLSLFGDVDNNSTITASTSGITAIKGAPAGVRPEKIQIGGFQQKSFLGKYNKKDSQTNNEYAALIKKHMAGPLVALTNEFFGPKLLSEFKPAGQIINKMRGNKGGALFPKGAEGSIFEASINALTKNAIGFEKTLKGDPNATWDFEEAGFVGPKLRDNFGFSKSLKLADGKRSVSSDAMTSLANKVFTSVNRGGGGGGSQKIKSFIKEMNTSAAAGGFIPSFNAINQAVQRERAAGVPMGKIRVGSNKSLASGLNPMGLGVYNTRDEPSGLGQGIRRSMARGLDPRSSGIPNFASGGKDSVGFNSMKLIGVTMALGFVQQALQSYGEGLKDNSEKTSKLISATDALQSALLVGGAVASAGMLLPERFKKNASFSMPSFGGFGGGTTPRSRTAFSERLPGGRGTMSAARFNMPATMFSGGISYERGKNTLDQPRLDANQQAGAIGNVQRTPSRFGAAMGRVGGSIARNASRAGLNRAGMAMGGPLGVAAIGAAAYSGTSTLVNETFNSSFQELAAASKNLEQVSQESEKNIGKLTKFGEAAENASKVFNDSNASMGQVLEAQKQMSKAMQEVPTAIRQRISGLVDPSAIQAVIQEGIEQQQKNKSAAQTRADAANAVREVRKTDFGIVDPFSELTGLTDTGAERGRDLRRVRGVASTALANLTPDQLSGLSGENAASLVKDLQLVGTTGFSEQAQKNVEEQLGNLGLDQVAIDAFMTGMQEGAYSAELIGEALSDEFIERRKAIQQEKELQPIREAMIKATRDQQKAIDDVKEAMQLEQKIRKETIKISSQAAKSFLSATGSINLDTMNKQNQFRADNAAKFGDSIAAASKAFGGTGTSVSGALKGGIENTLAIARTAGVGSLDKRVVEAQTAALRAQAEKATAEERGPLEALATQLENLNATSDRLYKDNVKQTYETTRIAAAQIAAARQAQRLKSFGGTASITDPSSLNNVLGQLSGARTAGMIAQRAGSTVGFAGAQASRFDAIQQLLGGQLPPQMLAQARRSASTVKLSQISAINRAEGLGLNKMQMQQIADEQASNLFKGEPLDRNNKNLESLNTTIQQNNVLLMASRSNASNLGGMQMQAAQAQQARYAQFQQNMMNNTRGSRRESLYLGQVAGQARDLSGYMGQVEHAMMSPLHFGFSQMGGDGPMTSYGAAQNMMMQQQALQRTMSRAGDRTVSNSNTSHVTNVYMNNMQMNPQNSKSIDQSFRNNIPGYTSATNRVPRGF